MGPERYLKAFSLLYNYVENGLPLYKASSVCVTRNAQLTDCHQFELRKLLWPVYVYSFLELVSQDLIEESRQFLNANKSHFQNVHGDDLKTFASIGLPEHLAENRATKLYRENRYRIPLNQHSSAQLFSFLEREEEAGGNIITSLLQTYCQVDSTARGPIEPYSFEAIFRRTQNIDLDDVDAQEGIPGVFTGISNKDILDPHTPLRLGPMPMEMELKDDVRAELEEEDQRHPPAEGVPTLADEFDRRIKREESADGPSRQDIPLPQSRARDVVMEMQKVRENRDRFKIEGRTGGIGAPVSICMFTFHNTCGV